MLNPERRSLRSRLIENWKPKLICLLLAVLVWVWVEVRYVESDDEWGLDEIRLSLPE
ncbi:MAG: hypothetical protein IKJ58_07110 [Akkermansia sp.]|nr:hypothetical protein [Akkermansia sp.]